MIAEAESILEADEAARKKVEAAGPEAERIRSDAQQAAREAIEGKMRELTASAAAEEEEILAEALSKVRKITEEADRYIEGLQEKKRARLSKLIDKLLEKVTGP